MNRETREIVASARGDRTENTCRILWDRIPSAYNESIYPITSKITTTQI